MQCLKGSLADRMLLSVLLIGTLFLWFMIHQQLSVGPATAYVYHQKTLLAKYPLPTDNTIIHVPATGELGISEIEISQHGIRFLSSPCTTHYCTRSGHKAHAGSVIACVPNKIMVVLRGSISNNPQEIQFDAVSE